MNRFFLHSLLFACLLFPGCRNAAKSQAAAAKSPVITVQTETPAASQDPGFELYIPNSISPNSETNDVWFVTYKGPPADVFQVSLFNRWGEKIYVSSDINFRWNGEDKSGVAQAMGTYMYMLEIQPHGLEKKQYSGYVTLIR
ncbi:MAG: pkd domain containing protein [Bacteroidetes bacterium]|nr:MAG: pkd domain containing protein [Bacteroidota bacterium]